MKRMAAFRPIERYGIDAKLFDFTASEQNPECKAVCVALRSLG
jgi:hypothetical protein